MEVILANRRLLTLLLVINGCYVSSHVTATGSQATDQHVSTHQAFVPTSVVQPTSMTVSIDQPTSMTVLALEGSTTSSMTYSDITTHPIMPSASSDTVKQGVSLPPTVMPSATSAGTLGESSLGTIGMLTTSSDIKRESKGSMETPLLTTGSIAILTTTATVSMEMSGTSSISSSSLHMLPPPLASNILSISASFEYESEITNLISSTGGGEITSDTHSSSITSEIFSNNDINTLTSSISSDGMFTNDVTNTLTSAFTYLTILLPSTDSILINSETFQSESSQRVNTVSLQSNSVDSSFIFEYTDVTPCLSLIVPIMTSSIYYDTSLMYDTSSIDSSNSAISAYSSPSIVPSITIETSSLNSVDLSPGLNSVTSTFSLSNNSPSSILDMSSGFSNLVVTPSSSNTDTTGQSTDSSFLSGMISTTYPQKTTNPSSAESLLPSTMLDNASTAMSILPSPSTSLPMPSSSLPVDETKPNADHSKGGLTNGGKAALGICIPIIIILVIVGIIYLFYRKRHYSASWKLSDVVSYRPWSYNNATYYDDEVW
ncbi:mucin-2 isoform X2 [Patella vulgata]|uniref:mucin-2 isoform X2 n=1 Tax=Patella vulgata TaxID=6465 RepID=UPI0024A84837|nr:mucin-2 isoform X2 [Patella vulgata]